MLLSLLACTQPSWHLLDPGHQPVSSPSDSPGDSEAASWEDPIVRGVDMDVERSGMELTDILRVSEDRIVLLGQQQQQDGGAWLVDTSDPDAPRQVDQLHSWVLQYGCWDGQWLWGATRGHDIYQVQVGRDSLDIEAIHMGIELGGTLSCDGQRVAWAGAADGAGLATVGEDELQDRVRFEGTWYAVEIVDEVLWTTGPEALASWSLEGALIGELELPGTCRALSEQQGLLALGCGAAGVLLVDASQPESPTLLGQWSGHASVRHVAWQGQHVLASAWAELLLLDVRDPTQPQLQATEPAASAVMAALPDGDGRAFVADWNSPFVVTWEDIEAPELRLSPPGSLPGEIVQVHNDGRVPLLLDAPSEGELSATRVEPGDKVQWLLPEHSQASTLELPSNDPDDLGLLSLGSSYGVPLGEPAPDFVEVDAEGQVWELSKLQGKVVWLGLFQEGCPVCATEVSETEAAMQRWDEEEDLVRLWAFAGGEGQARDWIEDHGIQAPVLLDYDNSVRGDYFVPNNLETGVFAANPRHYVIDREGILVYASTTVAPEDEEQVLQAALDSEDDGR